MHLNDHRRLAIVLILGMLFNTLFVTHLSARTIVSETEPRLEKLILSGPAATLSAPMMRIVETNALADIAAEVEYVGWMTPDQMRALTLNGDTDFMAMPTNVAANLYNRGAKLSLLNVAAWGILWMVSRDAELKTLADFKGKEIAIPFRGDMPDIVFNKLAQEQGLNPKKDFKIRYVAQPLDAMKLLILRRVDHALLVEPAVSMALRKTQSYPIKLVAPELHRSINLQTEWEQQFNVSGGIPQAGITLLKSHSPRVVSRFNEEYEKALEWCLQNPMATGELVKRYNDMLTPEAVADSLQTTGLRYQSAGESHAALEQFFQQLYSSSPALIGNKLPDDQFYYGYQTTAATQ